MARPREGGATFVYCGGSCRGWWRNSGVSEVGGAVRFRRDRDIIVLAELIEGWCRGHLRQARTRENRDRLPLCEQRITRDRDDKRLTPSKLVSTQTCGERGEINISLFIGKIEEAVCESTGEDKDRVVEGRLKVLRW